MSPSAGRLIAVEGADGVGKTTQASRLARALGAEIAREPGGTTLGEELRSLLLSDLTGSIDPRAELLVMAAARAEHVAERLEPLLSSGRDVVVDRFYGSTLAYQGYGRGLDLDEVRRVALFAAAGRMPDLNVVIDLPVSLAQSRLETLGQPDRIEAEPADFHDRVRAGFLAEAAKDPARWCVVDGSGSEEEVAALVLSEVARRLGLEDDS